MPVQMSDCVTRVQHRCRRGVPLLLVAIWSAGPVVRLRSRDPGAPRAMSLRVTLRACACGWGGFAGAGSVGSRVADPSGAIGMLDWKRFGALLVWLSVSRGS